MLQSKLFSKTRQESPKDEQSKNAILLIKAGYVYKEMAGVFSLLPLGLRVVKNIEKIIKEEMDAIGGEEIYLSALQDRDSWEKTGRWNDEIVDVWFKTKLKNESELGLAYTHEPAITSLMKDYISSYRDLPIYPYQFQTKFRNELRAKSGLFRGREFLMKDLYSFNRTEEELDQFYDKAIIAYKKIFNRLGIGDKTFITLASGGSFGVAYSHEFQTLTSAGEDIIYVHKGKEIAINKEVYNDETIQYLGVDKSELVEEKSVEVGNIYKLGTFYSGPLGLNFKDENGNLKPVIMGSYGLGIQRIMGTIVEVLSEGDSMIWPKEVSPFKVHIIDLSSGDEEIKKESLKLYEDLKKAGIDSLFDDREERAGSKFADADMIGIPVRIVVSKKTESSGVVEVNDRKTKEVSLVPKANITSAILDYIN